MITSKTTKPVRVPALIHRADLQSRTHRVVFAVMSALGWSALLYLFAPLFGLAASALGYKGFDHEGLTGIADAILPAGIYAAIILVESALLLSWAFYNLWRFSSNDRRLVSASVSHADLAGQFRLCEIELARLHAGRVVRVHHDASGGIERIEVLDDALDDGGTDHIASMSGLPDIEIGNCVDEWAVDTTGGRARRA